MKTSKNIDKWRISKDILLAPQTSFDKNDEIVINPKPIKDELSVYVDGKIIKIYGTNGRMLVTVGYNQVSREEHLRTTPEEAVWLVQKILNINKSQDIIIKKEKNKNSNFTKEYTENDIKELKTLYEFVDGKGQKLTIKQIAEKTGRSYEAVKSKIRRLYGKKK